MARDLVSGPRDVAHQVGEPLRHPPEHEEGRARVRAREQIEQAADVVADAQLAAWPLSARDRARVVLDLEPVLHIDREHVAQVARCGRGMPPAGERLRGECADSESNREPTD